MGTATFASSTRPFQVALQTNAVLVLVFFILFCVLRRRYAWLYSPNTSLPEEIRFNLDPLPNGYLNWIPALSRINDELIFRTAGLDALVYIRFFKLCCKMFLACCVVAIPLIVVHSNNELSVEGLDRISISNVPKRSPHLWIHCVFAYLLTAVFFWLFRSEYRYFLHMRHRYLRLPSLRHTRTLMVSNIPKPMQESDSTLAVYFQRIFPDSVTASVLVKDVSGLVPLLKKRRNYLAQIEAQLYNLDRDPTTTRPSWIAVFWNCQFSFQENPEQIELRIRKLNRLLRRELSLIPALPKGSGFVTFRSHLAVDSALGLPLEPEPHVMDTKRSPEPRDIHWPSMGIPKIFRNFRWILSRGFFVLLLFFWTVPVGFVASMTSLESLTRDFPVFQAFLDYNPWLQSLLTGFLSTLAYNLFLILLPTLLSSIAVLKGIESRSWQDMSVLRNFFLFVLFFMFFLQAIAGTILQVLSEVIAHPPIVLPLLALNIPKYASFFASFILLRISLGLGMLMLNPFQAIYAAFNTMVAMTPSQKVKALEPLPLYYGAEVPISLLVFVIGVSYALTAPLLSFVALVFFGLGTLVHTYVLVYAMKPRFESGGMMWPTIFSRMVVGIIAAQLTLIGLMGLKEAPFQGTALLPLPFLTYFFLNYMRSQYGPRVDSLPMNEAVDGSSEKLAFFRHSPKGKEIESSRSAPLAQTAAAVPSVQVAEEITQTSPASLRSPFAVEDSDPRADWSSETGDSDAEAVLDRFHFQSDSEDFLQPEILEALRPVQVRLASGEEIPLEVAVDLLMRQGRKYTLLYRNRPSLGNRNNR